MRLCPNGHPLPESANGYCARCAHEARNSGRFSKQRGFDPERYFGGGRGSGNPYPPERTELPPDKRMPDFSRLSEPKPATKPSAKTKSPPTHSPERILEGIKRLLVLACGKEATVETILLRVHMKPQKIAELINAHHPFVRDVREAWFTLFKDQLIREEARVIARSVGLDGLTRPITMNELAERCQMSMDETKRHGGSGLRKLREQSNRSALVYCVVKAAEKYR